MENLKKVEWILRIAVSGEFLGHGIFAIQGKAAWINWIEQLLNVDASVATQLLLLIGIIDIGIAIFALVQPIRAILLWAAIWGFWTALLRPIMGDPIWDFVERFANIGAPLALLYVRGVPRSLKQWLKV
ncbi:hypothetical protein CL632_00740 [bacterium]|jgi:hypothetical protein|nr:hypothetical protein [bacterium]MDP6571484.1 hypothetical protein [Patescibacteria group bacterium]MDP6756553.1 hypothetical protein [Patescibacteria group bacterium]|tara:strand:+ start:42068 stop:42454 length:387 start_codon:yes stop_codon:yes gene_type:complete